jgi:hypothetical protein
MATKPIYTQGTLKMIDPNSEKQKGNPETLIAEIVAARRAGDRDRERAARQKLKSQFCVKLLFADELEVDNDR